jgi:hypothetical protein
VRAGTGHGRPGWSWSCPWRCLGAWCVHRDMCQAPCVAACTNLATHGVTVHICGEQRRAELAGAGVQPPPVHHCIGPRPQGLLAVWPGLSRRARTTMRHSLEQLCRDPHPRRRSPSPATWRITSPPRHPSARAPPDNTPKQTTPLAPVRLPLPRRFHQLDLMCVPAPIPAAMLSRGATPSTATSDPPTHTGHRPHAHTNPCVAGRPARLDRARALVRRGRRRAEDKSGVQRARRPAMAPHPRPELPRPSSPAAS